MISVYLLLDYFKLKSFGFFSKKKLTNILFPFKLFFIGISLLRGYF